MTQGISGHNGLLCLLRGGTVTRLTSIEGANWNWNTPTANWGGFGNGYKRAVNTMPGPVTVDISKFAWDDSTLGDLIHDVLDEALSGYYYTYYLYPKAYAGVTTQYLYGSFGPVDVGFEMSVDDIITQPFGLIQTGDVFRVGM